MAIQIRTVNKELRKQGLKCELVKGEGYFYFVPDEGVKEGELWEDAEFAVTLTVPTYHLNSLTLEQWIEEVK